MAGGVKKAPRAFRMEEVSAVERWVCTTLQPRATCGWNDRLRTIAVQMVALSALLPEIEATAALNQSSTLF
jgi:hypothetical protein